MGKDNPQIQIAQTFETIRKILQAAGTSPENVIEIDTHLTDTSYLQAYRTERQKFFSQIMYHHQHYCNCTFISYARCDC